MYVIPIVYPAVPMSAPRIRTNLTMLHTAEDIKRAVEMLSQAGRDVGVLKKSNVSTMGALQV